MVIPWLITQSRIEMEFPPPFFMPIKVYKWKHPTGPSLAILIQSNVLTWSVSFDRHVLLVLIKNLPGITVDPPRPFWGWCGWSDVFYVTMPPISCSGRIEPFFPFFFFCSPWIFHLIHLHLTKTEDLEQRNRNSPFQDLVHIKPVIQNPLLNKADWVPAAVVIKVTLSVATCVWINMKRPYRFESISKLPCAIVWVRWQVSCVGWSLGFFLRHIRFIVFNIGNTKWLCQIPRMAGNKEGEHSLCICDLTQVSILVIACVFYLDVLTVHVLIHLYFLIMGLVLFLYRTFILFNVSDLIKKRERARGRDRY